MNHLIPSGRFALPFVLLFATLLTGCGAGSIRSSLPDQKTTLYLSEETTVDFSVTGSTGDNLSYSWDIIHYNSNNQPVSTQGLPGATEQARRHTFTASDFGHFRTEVRVTLYQTSNSGPGSWPVSLPLASVTWEISKPVEKLGTQIPGSLFLRNPNDLPNLTGISDVTGHVFMDGTAFLESAPLNSVTHIGGDLVVNNTKIRTANDLHLNPALVLDGSLQVLNNGSLTSLAGLEFFTQLSKLTIENNRVLKNLTGLDGLERIDGSLLVKNNLKLTDLTGAGRLESIGGSLILDDNFTLASTKGMEALQNVQRDVSLLSNPWLVSLEGFAGLRQIGGVFAIDYTSSQTKNIQDYAARMPNLSGLDALTHAGAISINANPRLVSLQGLNQLTTVARYLHIGDNARLENLRGLENLSSISNISLSLNPRLRNLQGLEQVRNLEYLTISSSFDNQPATTDGLTSLAGIEAIGTIKNLTLSGNPLSDLSAGKCVGHRIVAAAL